MIDSIGAFLLSLPARIVDLGYALGELLVLAYEHPTAAIGLSFILLAAFTLGGMFIHFRREDREARRRNRSRYDA